MTKVVEAHILQAGIGPDTRPEFTDGAMGNGSRGSCRRKHPRRTPWKRRQDLAGGRRQPDHARPRLGIREVEMTLAILGPLERQDLLAAAPGQKQEADDRHICREARFMVLQHTPEPADFLDRAEALPSPPSVAPDAPARIASLGPVSIVLRTGHDDRENRQRPVGSDRRRMQGGEPLLDVAARDLRDLASLEPREELLAVVALVDVERTWLPCAPVPAKDLLRDRLKQGLVG